MSMSAPTIITRSEWRANPFKGNPVPQPRYQFLTLHMQRDFPHPILTRAKSK